MPVPNQILLYVSDPAKSAAFYTRLLGRPPLLQSPNIAIYDLDGGWKLGLWAKTMVGLPVAADSATGELSFTLASDSALQALHRDWTTLGVRMALEPQPIYFGGTTFVGLDPDGHRLRVIATDQP